MDNRSYHVALAASVVICAALSGTDVILTRQVLSKVSDMAIVQRQQAQDGSKAEGDAKTGSQRDVKSSDGDGGTASYTVTDTSNIKTNETSSGAEASDGEDAQAGAGQTDGGAALQDAPQNDTVGKQQAQSQPQQQDQAQQQSTVAQAQPQATEQQAQPAQGQAEPVAAEPAAPATWNVESGDTLASISRATGVSVDAIANANGIRDVNVIYAGSSLVIPAA